MLIELTTEVQPMDWGAVLIQALITFGVVFGGAGFWEFLKTKFIAKREDKKAEDGTEAKVDKVIDQMTLMTTQVTSLSEDMQVLKKDLSLLQEANEATIKYRQLRDSRDQEALKIQDAIIKSITGLMRDRLLDNYRRCIKKGYYTMEEREIYGAMFDCYESSPFNGNGVMHDLRPLMKSLPLEAPDSLKNIETSDDE